MRRVGSRTMSLAVLALGAALPLLAQAQAMQHDRETTASVPALDAMHEVIMPLWHDAWPAKNYKMMADLLADLEKHARAVATAELPGILRDKQAAWKQGVATLQASIGDYRAAITAGHNEALLKAAERVHTNYEALVRTIRPVTPEVASFHQALYVLYHYDKETFVLSAVASNVRTLKAKMDALATAALPARFTSKEADYTAARDRLAASVNALVAAVDSKDEARIKAAIDDVHGHYQALEQVFGS